MEILRYKYIFVLMAVYLAFVSNAQNSTTVCPFTKIIEDIYKIHNNKTSKDITLKDHERAKIFLNSIAKVTINDDNTTKTSEAELVNDIIASINRIKSNMTPVDNNNDNKMNEAIILNISKDNQKNVSNRSELDNESKENNKLTNLTTNSFHKKLNKVNSNATHEAPTIDKILGHNSSDLNSAAETSTEPINYVEILTIEPNNTNTNSSTSHNIIEVLKHLMPMFNSTLEKEHNITIIESTNSKNTSVNSIKNMSTIIVTFCEKENLTKANVTFDSPETDIKHDASSEYDYSSEEASYESDDDYDDNIETNLTVGEKKDILEATKYGVQKMHELYSVLEPKLYSMGLWLDDANPARYVAAFNAPSEDVAKYSRYGYASLQAATKLKQLISGSVSDGLQSRADEVQFPAASALRQSPLLQHCPLKGAPKCPPASKRYRTHDGTCNNLNRPRWGSTMTPVQRFLTPSYSDGLQAPRRSVTGIQLPSAREISSLIHEDANVENPSITHLLMQWGQFLDHDVTSSSQSRGFNGSVPRCCKDGGRDFIAKEFLHPECMPIAVPPSDPFYGPRGVRCLDFIRSSPAPRDDCALGWREQLNQVSAYIDASPVYASSARQSDRLRSFRNGMLQYGRSQQRRDELCRGGAVSTDCFKSGDARVNEHPGLVAAHIVWLRQHNRMAQELANLNPQWSDEKIYQETRKIVGAMVQHITYREFLPIVLGSEVMRLFELEPLKKGFFKGYDPKVNPSPASSFGSAAFRFGHSLVQSSMVRFDRFHRPLNNNVSLHDELTNLSNIWSIGAVDRLLLGMVNQPIQKRDEFITEELTNHLFQTPSFNFGMDLAAINIQRGRDHGVPAYTDWREPCGLSAIRSFGDLFKVMPMRVVRKLQNIYRHVDDIDLFTGGMAERPVVGGLVGPTFACIIAQQFSNLRKGDRFWYENGGFDSSFTPAQLQQIRRISFAQILCHTLDAMETIQPFVFLSSDNSENGRISCRNGLLNDFDLSPWIEINSEFNNDIRQADDDDNEPPTRKPTTQKPKRPKPTTTRRPTTTKKTSNLVAVASNKVSHKPAPANLTDTNKLTERQNKTESTMNDNDNATDIFTLTVSGIDDKLDFRNKSKRFDDTEPKEKTRHNVKTQTKQQYNDYDDDDNVQSVQTVVINNLPHKRPYNNNYHNRPIMTVTENIDKYTYLINYVPRPTESYRPTTRRTLDRDVVKVTYQTYADTYRRPNKPYYNNYNRHDDENNNDYYRNERPVSDFEDNFYRRHERPNLHSDKSEILHSSARSNEDIMSPKPTATLEKTDNNSPTTDNLYKLVTFGYVGTYKGNNLPEKTTKTTDNRPDTISKDFSTYDNTDRDNEKTMKLSTFFSYETATKPYSNLQRSTRRHDDDLPNYKNSNTKYYYVKNVLHKYPTDDINSTDKPIDSELKDIALNNKNIPNILENVEERSVADKLDFFDDEEKSNKPPNKVRNKIKKPASPAKTPSVAFQVIPSENTPYQWAIYDEKEDLPESLPHKMPPIKTDPHALKEIPKPMIFNLRRRRPGRS